MLHVERLRGTVEALGILEHCYSLYGPGNGSGELVIHAEGPQWVVYAFERGERLQEIRFDRESDACRYLLGWLVDVYGTHST